MHAAFVNQQAISTTGKYDYQATMKQHYCQGLKTVNNYGDERISACSISLNLKFKNTGGTKCGHKEQVGLL